MSRRVFAFLVAAASTAVAVPLMPATAAQPRLTGVGSMATVINADLARTLATTPADTQLVVFVHADDVRTSTAAVEAVGLTKLTTWHSIGVTVARGTPALVTAVAKQSGVTYVEPNQAIHLLLDTANTATRASDARAMPTLFDANGVPYDGTGTSIAINDSGVDGMHEMFTENGVSKVKMNLRESCHDLACQGLTVNMAKTPFNDSDTIGAGGHGTHVAGIAAGYQRTTQRGRVVRGAAPGATLVGYGMGAALAIYAPNAGLQWVLDNHANPCLDGSCPPIRVVNNSWGPVGGSREFDPMAATSKLTSLLVDEGVVVVFAAGNDGGNGTANAVNPYAQNPKPGVIAVANYNDQNSGTRNGPLSGSSSRGAAGRPETYPDVSAPGSSITSACEITLPVCTSADVNDPHYGTISGTSMAAPYISGIVAVLAQADPTLTPGEIEDVLEDTAYKFTFGAPYESDLPSRNSDNTTSFDKGHGLVDVVEALTRVLA